MSESSKSILRNFEEYIFETAKEYLIPAKIEELIHAYKKEIKKYPVFNSSLSNLSRIIDSLYNKFSFFSDSLKYEHHIEILIAISFNSNYLTDIIVRNPEFLYQLFDQSYLQKKLVAENLNKEITQSLNNYKSFQAKINYLRLLKRRYTLKIGVYDILKIGNLEEVTSQISALASSISSALFEICYDETLEKNELERPGNKFAIISLGKLGGDELNYSSDIDLMFVFDKNTKLKSKIKRDYNEIFQESIKLFVQTSNFISEQGFIYRVDLRLRPDGQQSPLARTLQDTIFYYESRGEAWERQMLIKANFMGGHKSFYDEFLKRVTPFIYPKSFMESPVAQIAKMRNDVENSASGKGDIKKSIGGIRDIEFLIQMMQMLNAGNVTQLRTGNSLTGLKELVKRNLLRQNEAEQMCRSYTYYRKIEHYLQLMNNIQTHEIPEDSELLTKLAFFMGHLTKDDFLAEVEKLKKTTRKIFNKYISGAGEIGMESNLFNQIKFTDDPRAKQNIRYLRNGTGLLGTKEFNSRTIELFKKIEPDINFCLQNSSNPDLVLENFHTLIKSSGMHSFWYQQLQNKQLLSDILFLCEYSRRFIDSICSNPEMSDYFFSGDIFVKNIESLFGSISMKHLLLIVTVQLNLKLIDQNNFSELISDYIRHHIAQQANKYFVNYKYFIAGLGSFGIREMTYSSDVDLIIVGEGLENLGDMQKASEEFIAETAKIIAPFTIDFKLRPEGRNAPIVSELNAYKEYLSGRAELWEFQAFQKISFITGDKNIYNKFIRAITSSYERLEIKDIYASIFNMHRRIINEKAGVLNKSIDIKYNHGGLLTIEYIADYLVLNDKVMYKKLIGKDYDSKVPELVTECFSKLSAETLLVNYHRLKSIEIIFQSITGQNKSKLPVDIDKNIYLNKAFNKLLGIELRSEMNKIFSEDNKIFQQLRK